MRRITGREGLSLAASSVVVSEPRRSVAEAKLQTRGQDVRKKV